MQRREFIKIMVKLTGAAIVAPEIIGELTWRHPEAAPQLWALMDRQRALDGQWGIGCEWVPVKFMDEIMQLAMEKVIVQQRRRAAQRIDKEAFRGLDNIDRN